MICTKDNKYREHYSKEDEIKANDLNIGTIVQNEVKRLGKRANLNHIEVREVTDMSALFHNLDFDGDIYLWDVSNVVDMSGMFAHSTFDGDISHWNVSNVKKHDHCFDDSPLMYQPNKQPKFNP